MKLRPCVEEVEGTVENTPDRLASVLCSEPGSTALSLATGATGAAFIMGDQCRAVGKCPSTAVIRHIVEWLQGAAAAGPEVGGAATFSTCSSARRLEVGLGRKCSKCPLTTI